MSLQERDIGSIIEGRGSVVGALSLVAEQSLREIVDRIADDPSKIEEDLMEIKRANPVIARNGLPYISLSVKYLEKACRDPFFDVQTNSPIDRIIFQDLGEGVDAIAGALRFVEGAQLIGLKRQVELELGSSRAALPIGQFLVLFELRMRARANKRESI